MLKLSPTAALTYEDCPRQYWYRYVVRAYRPLRPAALGFGDAVHQAIEQYLRAGVRGESCDPVAAFTAVWDHHTATTALEYPNPWSAAELRATGQRLLALFPGAWAQAELALALDGQGEPLLERRLEAPLAPGLNLTGKPDLVVLDAQLRTLILDLKTPSQAGAIEAFEARADQLAAYQLLLDANAEALGGLEPVAGVGFWELVKRKVASRHGGKGPEIRRLALAPARTPDQLADLRQKWVWLAEDIGRGRFPRRPRQAHNSPCLLCDFRRHCAAGEDPELCFPDSAPASPAPNPVAKA